MKRKQITSILLSFMLVVPAFITPFAHVSAYAAEPAESAEEVEAVEETEVVEATEAVEEIEEPVNTEAAVPENGSTETDAPDEKPNPQPDAGSAVQDSQQKPHQEPQQDSQQNPEETENEVIAEEGDIIEDGEGNIPEGFVFKGVVPVMTEGQEVIPEDISGKSSDDLFAEYVENCFGTQPGMSRLSDQSDQPGQLGQSGRKASAGRMAPKSTGAGLVGINRAVYDSIASCLPQIAAGERSSTVFEIAVDELGLAQIFWTSEELGVASVFVLDSSGNIIIDDDGYASVSPEASAAVEAMTAFDLSMITSALMADCPYQLYWYDKTQEIEAAGCGITAFYNDEIGDYVVGITGSISISFPVADEYSAGEYMVDTSVGQSVQASVTNADAIVEQYSGATDYEKLCGYKDEICELVSYNEEAAAGGVSYGNPWQMIWVFDGDPDTNVVCEGYAKAFKYLCDRTEFSGDISCIIVTGTMTGGTGEGPHMWNIVNMEDGHNYLVDMTNCDENTIGENGSLFLAGYYLINDDGYTCTCGTTWTWRMSWISLENIKACISYCNADYCYDQNTLNIYSSEELSLNNDNYGSPSKIVIDESVFPDEAFRNMVLNNADKDGDGALSNNEIRNFTVIAIEEGNVYSLEGIDVFFNLYAIYCPKNNLKVLRYSGGNELKIVHCYYNSIREIDLGYQPDLDYLLASYNNVADLAYLHLDSYPNLSRLDCEFNKITNLDFSFPNKLMFLYVDNNEATQICLSGCTRLKTLVARFNSIRSLDTTNLTYLVQLFVSYNRLEELDVSNTNSLKSLDCSNNRIQSLDVSGCPELETLECGFNRIGELILSENLVLKRLNCSSNQIKDLDVSLCTQLEYLICSINPISNIDISQNAELEHLDLGTSMVRSLNLENNSKLKILAVNDCKIKDLNLDELKSIESLYASGNNLERLDLSQNTELETIHISNSRISELNIEKCKELEHLDCSYNDLRNLNIDNNEKLRYLQCDGNSIRILDISNCPKLDYAVKNGTYEDDPTMISVRYEYTGDTDPYAVILDRSVDLSCVGHTYHSKIVSAEQEDSNGIFICENCGKLFSDENCENEITIEDIPITDFIWIIKDPDDVVAAEGETVELNIETIGNNVTYQWQWSAEGTAWKNCASAGYDSDSFTFKMKKSLSDRMYRCKVKSGDETLFSETAAITLAKDFEIIENPADVEAKAGDTVAFSVDVIGNAPVYQWQWSRDGIVWKNCTSAGHNTDTFIFGMKESLSGRLYRCKVICGEETLISKAASITLEKDFEIVTHPSGVEAKAGAFVELSVEVWGERVWEEGVDYQWQWSSNGTTWKNCTSGGYNKDTFSFTMKASLDGRQYRCKVTCGGETLISDAATITLFRAVEIISQPCDVQAAVGETVVFTVEAQSNVEGEDPACQWQWSSNGTTWKNCTSGGYNKDTFSFTMKATLSGRQYRCKVTCGGETVISEVGTITLK